MVTIVREAITLDTRFRDVSASEILIIPETNKMHGFAISLY